MLVSESEPESRTEPGDGVELKLVELVETWSARPGAWTRHLEWPTFQCTNEEWQAHLAFARSVLEVVLTPCSLLVRRHYIQCWSSHAASPRINLCSEPELASLATAVRVRAQARVQAKAKARGRGRGRGRDKPWAGEVQITSTRRRLISVTPPLAQIIGRLFADARPTVTPGGGSPSPVRDAEVVSLILSLLPHSSLSDGLLLRESPLTTFCARPDVISVNALCALTWLLQGVPDSTLVHTVRDAVSLVWTPATTSDTTYVQTLVSRVHSTTDVGHGVRLRLESGAGRPYLRLAVPATSSSIPFDVALDVALTCSQSTTTLAPPALALSIVMKEVAIARALLTPRPWDTGPYLLADIWSTYVGLTLDTSTRARARARVPTGLDKGLDELFCRAMLAFFEARRRMFMEEAGVVRSDRLKEYAGRLFASSECDVTWVPHLRPLFCDAWRILDTWQTTGTEHVGRALLPGVWHPSSQSTEASQRALGAYTVPAGRLLYGPTSVFYDASVGTRDAQILLTFATARTVALPPHFLWASLAPCASRAWLSRSYGPVVAWVTHLNGRTAPAPAPAPMRMTYDRRAALLPRVAACTTRLGREFVVAFLTGELSMDVVATATATARHTPTPSGDCGSDRGRGRGHVCTSIHCAVLPSASVPPLSNDERVTPVVSLFTWLEHVSLHGEDGDGGEVPNIVDTSTDMVNDTVIAVRPDGGAPPLTLLSCIPIYRSALVSALDWRLIDISGRPRPRPLTAASDTLRAFLEELYISHCIRP